MDLRHALPLILLLTLTACGKQKTASETFQKASQECESEIYPNQFVIRYNDHSIRAVKANSKEEFLRDYVEPDLDRVDYTENDFLVRNSDAVVEASVSSADNWWTVKVEADTLWPSARGAGVVVAVVDSGMDMSHPQLSSQVATNAGEIPGNGIDDDHNGFVDDVNGWDFVANKPLQGDYQIHGTHVSGIIAAAHSDTAAGPSIHVQGIAPSAKILPLAFLNKDGEGPISAGVKAIQYAVTRGAQVINASWGGPFCSRSLRDEVSDLANSGTIFVVASGNNGYNIDRYPDYPAALNAPTQITVGATGFHDLMADFSNYGYTNVHLFAPGEGIISTVPGGMQSLRGTSMAAPVVSGAVALLLSAEPTATAAQVRQALYNVAFKQSNFINASHGRLDLKNALAELRHQMGK